MNSGKPEADPGLELGCGALERRVGRAVGRTLEGWVGHAPVDELGSGREVRADLPDAVAQGDHRVEPLRAELVEVLGAVRADVDPVRTKDADGVGMQRLRMAARAGGLDRTGRHVVEQRFGDLGPRAVARAQEQHPRSPARAVRSWTLGRRRAEAQRRVQRSPCALQGIAAGVEVDGVVAVAAICRAAVRGHESAFPEQTQVVRHQALRLVDQRHELPHRPIALHELAQQPPPQRVRGQPYEGWRGATPRIGDGRRHPLDSTEVRQSDQSRLMQFPHGRSALVRRSADLRR